MRTLISELLDFRKQEQGYLKLKVECRDIVALGRSALCFFFDCTLLYRIVHAGVCDIQKDQMVLTYDISPTGRWVTYRIAPMEYNPENTDAKTVHLFDTRTRKESSTVSML